MYPPAYSSSDANDIDIVVDGSEVVHPVQAYDSAQNISAFYPYASFSSYPTYEAAQEDRSYQATNPPDYGVYAPYGAYLQHAPQWPPLQTGGLVPQHMPDVQAGSLIATHVDVNHSNQVSHAYPTHILNDSIQYHDFYAPPSAPIPAWYAEYPPATHYVLAESSATSVPLDHAHLRLDAPYASPPVPYASAVYPDSPDFRDRVPRDNQLYTGIRAPPPSPTILASNADSLACAVGERPCNDTSGSVPHNISSHTRSAPQSIAYATPVPSAPSPAQTATLQAPEDIEKPVARSPALEGATLHARARLGCAAARHRSDTKSMPGKSTDAQRAELALLACVSCKKRFSSASEAAGHRRHHASYQPFVCMGGCRGLFARSKDRTKHWTERHDCAKVHQENLKVVAARLSSEV